MALVMIMTIIMMSVVLVLTRGIVTSVYLYLFLINNQY
jgi:hypothetical protein